MTVITIQCRNGQAVRLEGDFDEALQYVRSLKDRSWNVDMQEWRTSLPATSVAQNAPVALGITIQEPLIPSFRKKEVQ